MRSRHRGPSCGPLGDSSLKTSEIVIPTSRPAGRASGQRRQKCSLSRARTRQPHSAGRPDRASRRSTHIRLITGPRTEAGASHGWGRRTGRDSRVAHGQRQPASGAAGPQRTRQPRVARALRGRVGGREAARRNDGVGGREAVRRRAAGILVSDRGERMRDVSIWTVSGRSELCMSVGIITH